MTENKAIERIKYRMYTVGQVAGEGGMEDLEMAINALEEIQRWHTSVVNPNIKNEFANRSTQICVNCDHKDEYIEELEAEVEPYRALEKRLTDMFGGELSLETVVDELERQLKEPDNPHPINAKILTYEDAAAWDAYRAIGTPEELQKAEKEENILKFYYCDSEDSYLIGLRVGNFYYAHYLDGSWVFDMSRYLPWGEHVKQESTAWKEHTFLSEPREINFSEWLKGFVKKECGGTPEECKKSVAVCKAMIARKITPENMEEYMKFEDECVKNGFTFDSLLKAREKQTAKKVKSISQVKDGDSYVGLIGRCPCCGDILEEDTVYCDCGQRLDWGTKNEERT